MRHWQTITLIVLFCSTLVADSRIELSTSPGSLQLSSTKPADPTVSYTAPKGKFKELAVDVLKHVQTPGANFTAEAWTTLPTDPKIKPGLLIVCPGTQELQINNLTCDTCPNSLFVLKGYGTEQEWIDDTLETWMRLDHGWNDPLARTMLRTRQVTKPRDDMKCVEFPHTEVKQYRAKVNGLK